MVHDVPTEIRAHDGKRSLRIAVAIHVDRLLQLRHLLRDERIQVVQPTLLVRYVRGQPAGCLQFARYRRLGIPVREQIALLAREQIASLPGLRILHGRHERLHLLDDFVRLRDAGRRDRGGLQRPEGKQGDQCDCDDRDHEAGQRSRR